MDELDKAIVDLRKKIERWSKQAEEGKVTLAALEKAAKLRPGGANAVRRPADADGAFFVDESAGIGAGPEEARKSGPGRRPGAISPEWRNVLLVLWMTGTAHSYAEIHKIALAQGINIADVASTRDRVRGFLANGLMTGTAEAGFTVTEQAAERFGFDTDDSAPPWDDDIPDGADKAEGA